MARFGAGSAVMLMFLRIAQGQTISPIPGFLQDVGGQIPVSEQFSFEPQFQLGLQGNSGNGNPFAYARGLQFRPWSITTGSRTSPLRARQAISTVSQFREPAITGIRNGVLRPSPP